MQVADSLVPLRKWKDAKANVSPGDVVLLKTEHKFGPGTYKLAIIDSVEHDAKGLVRTCVIGSRPKDSRDPTLPLIPKKHFLQEVPVQRLVLLVPKDKLPVAVPSEAAKATGDTETERGSPAVVSAGVTGGLKLRCRPHRALYKIYCS